MRTIPDSQIKVNRKGLIALIEYDRWMSEKDDEMMKVGVSINHGPDSPWVIQILLDLLGFPENLEDDPEGFCRDYLTMGPLDDGRFTDDLSADEYLDWLLEQKRQVSSQNN